MPSTDVRQRPYSLWVRMVAACLVVGLVGAAVFAAEATFFAALVYKALVALDDVLRGVTPDPTVRLVGATLAVACTGVVVGATYRAARRPDTDTDHWVEFAPNLFMYAYFGLFVASFLVVYWVIRWLALPNWAFALVVVGLLASVYPTLLYQYAKNRSSDDEWTDRNGEDATEDGGDERDTTWRERLATGRDRLERVGVELWRPVAALHERFGALGVLAAAGVALGGVAALVALANTRSPGTLRRPVAAVLGLGVAAVHVGSEVRSELTETVVLRELDGAFDGPVSEAATERVRRRVRPLAAQADVPVPDVRVVRSPTPTAAAVGYRPSTSTLVVSTGLVDALADDELDAVLAHELAHIKNRDAAVLTALSAPRVAARRVFDRYGVNPVMAAFAGVTAATCRVCAAAVARAREYAADDGATAVTGDPAALASALERLDGAASRRPDADLRSAAGAFAIVPPPWEEHRFFDRARRLVARGLLGTHPPTDARVDRLRARARALEREQ